MTDHMQSESPRDDDVNFGRRDLLKTLIAGVAGLAFTSVVISPAAAAKRRRNGKGQPQQNGRIHTPSVGHAPGKSQGSGKGKRRHH